MPESLALVPAPYDKPIAAASVHPPPAQMKRRGCVGTMCEYNLHLVNLLHSSGAVDELLELVFVDQMVGDDECQ